MILTTLNMFKKCAGTLGPTFIREEGGEEGCLERGGISIIFLTRKIKFQEFLRDIRLI